ncbi:hypothetical protein ACFWHV_21755 [Streptomyces collinus]|uniref:hypothetical protein n=1 Tax=Streptomyces collinus TaxID=42684 RepID=UPI00365BC395
MAVFTRACDATAEEERQALKLWRAARAEERGILATLQAPLVPNVRTLADFTAALAAAYERAGAPPLRVLLERATASGIDGALLLPPTTAWRMTRRQSRVSDWTQCEAFLRGCGIHPRRMRSWHEAWKRAQAHAPMPAERAVSAPTATVRYSHTALAPGLQVFAETVVPMLQSLVRGVDVDALAPGVKVFAERMGPMLQTIRREAHRNGTSAPDWNTTASHIGNELSHTLAGSASTLHTDAKGYHGGAAVHQDKSRRVRPGPHPALPGARTL